MATRFHGLRRVEVLGRRVAVARGPGSRLLGLALLRRERAGPGLLIPGCRSIHTFGMRFDLDLFFLDARGQPTSIRLALPPNRVASDRSAVAVLEVPSASPEGGESVEPST